MYIITKYFLILIFSIVELLNNTYNINSCDVIEVFYNLRTELDKLESAANITKIVNDVATENENNYKNYLL